MLRRRSRSSRRDDRGEADLVDVGDVGATRAEVEAAATRAFREEWGRVVATLIRLTGDWDLAEECAQEAYGVAVDRWRRDGVPRSPGAWLTTVARNRALDRLRRSRNEAAKYEEIVVASLNPAPYDGEPSGRDQSGSEPYEGADSGIADERLRLIFTCCHPALSMEAQVALTLRTLAGLTTVEIARAFVVPPETMAKASRARQEQDPQRRDPLSGAARPPSPRAHRGGARSPVPVVQRGLQRHRRG